MNSRMALYAIIGAGCLAMGTLATFLLPDDSHWVIWTVFITLCGGLVLLYPVAMHLWGFR